MAASIRARAAGVDGGLDGGAPAVGRESRTKTTNRATRLDSAGEEGDGDVAVLVRGFNSDGEVPGDGGELGIVAAVEKLGLGFRLGFPKGRVRGGEREAGHGALCIHLRQGGPGDAACGREASAAWRTGLALSSQ